MKRLLVGCAIAAALIPATAHARTVSRPWLHRRIERWARHYGASPRTAHKLARKGVAVATRESGRRTQARNGSYRGIFQMRVGGFGTARQLRDPDYCARRFCKVWDRQGWRGLRRHWKATWR